MILTFFSLCMRCPIVGILAVVWRIGVLGGWMLLFGGGADQKVSHGPSEFWNAGILSFADSSARHANWFRTRSRRTTSHKVNG